MIYRYILFDLDGTITDSKTGIVRSVQYSLERMGFESADSGSLEKFIGPPLRNSFIDYYNLSESDADRALRFYREYYNEKGIFENSLYPGIKPLLEKLSGDNRTLALATSKPTVYASRILDHFDLTGCFRITAGSNLDNTRTDKREIIEYILDELNIGDKKAAVMVGDRMHDIIGARKTGISSIAVLYGYGSETELSAENPDHIVESVSSLTELLNPGR